MRKVENENRPRGKRILTTIWRYAVSSSRWRLAAAFISGMVLTAAAAQALAFANDLSHREAMTPVPQNTPKLYEPGIFPDKNPAEHRINELVYAFSEEARISS